MRKLRLLRIRRGLTQEDMADRCELSKGFISQVERNLASPSIATLTDMLECLGSSLSQFFSEDKDEKTVFTPQDMFVKEDEQLCGSITWLVPDARRRTRWSRFWSIWARMGGHTSCYRIRAKNSAMCCQAASSWWTAKRKRASGAGSSFCLHPHETHYLMNAGKSHAKVLWISTPPSF